MELGNVHFSEQFSEMEKIELVDCQPTVECEEDSLKKIWFDFDSDPKKVLMPVKTEQPSDHFDLTENTVGHFKLVGCNPTVDIPECEFSMNKIWFDSDPKKVLMPVKTEQPSDYFEPTENTVEHFEPHENFENATVHFEPTEKTGENVELTENSEEHFEPIIISNITEISHPITQKLYKIGNETLQNFLEDQGTLVETFEKDSEEIIKLVRDFCDNKTVPFLNKDCAQKIKNSGYKIDIISSKSCKVTKTKGPKSKFLCHFCPLMNCSPKFFQQKENLIRHNALHLNYFKFKCALCDHKHFRYDTIKQHINLKHKERISEGNLTTHIVSI
jgi:hypothetical protein